MGPYVELDNSCSYQANWKAGSVSETCLYEGLQVRLRKNSSQGRDVWADPTSLGLLSLGNLMVNFDSLSSRCSPIGQIRKLST